MSLKRKPFIVVPKPNEGWADRTQLDGGSPYCALGGEIYAPPDQTAGEVQEMYAYWVTAPRSPYDEQNAWIRSAGRQCAEIILRRQGLPKDGGAVLDVAMGTGLVSQGLTDMLSPSTKYVGFDLTAAMLQHARAKPELSGHAIARADARHLPFKSNTFDVVVGSLFINHITCPQERLKVFEGMKRVLRQGGLLVLIDTPHNPAREAIAHEMAGVFPDRYGADQYSHTSPNAPNGFMLDYHIAQKDNG